MNNPKVLHENQRAMCFSSSKGWSDGGIPRRVLRPLALSLGGESLFLWDSAALRFWHPSPPAAGRCQKPENPLSSKLDADFLTFGGGRGIRTPGTLPPNSFQDCRHRPLGHSSGSDGKFSNYPVLSQKFLQRGERSRLPHQFPSFFSSALSSAAKNLYWNSSR